MAFVKHCTVFDMKSIKALRNSVYKKKNQKVQAVTIAKYGITYNTVRF